MKFILEYADEDETPWTWAVAQQDNVVAISPTSYDTEAEARSAIARARKAFAGYKFAKVVAQHD